MENHAVSRFLPLTIMCWRKMPSKVKPTQRSLPRRCVEGIALPFVTAITEHIKDITGHEVHRLGRERRSLQNRSKENAADFDYTMCGIYSHVRGVADGASRKSDPQWRKREDLPTPLFVASAGRKRPGQEKALQKDIPIIYFQRLLQSLQKVRRHERTDQGALACRAAPVESFAPAAWPESIDFIFNRQPEFQAVTVRHSGSSSPKIPRLVKSDITLWTWQGNRHSLPTKNQRIEDFLGR